MQTTLYASLTANGFLVRAGGEREIPAPILTDFLGHVRRCGNVVVGRRTAELIRATGSPAEFAGINVVVLSRNPGRGVATSPEEALRLLAARGHAEALLGGGAGANASFLERGLVDDIYLNVVPVLTPAGPALPAAPQPADLRLLDVRQLAGSAVQMHYRAGA
ncbi:dihydrofolate reductase family protein [Phytohabitans sp. LJ34]|uniref:dihydrofolate reductase family protein n=1 Tax=Phytohabitans sp. LJ34 TaxID=3452217 RepID=UPI003F89FB79